jgi:hypothetical protein
VDFDPATGDVSGSAIDYPTSPIISTCTAIAQVCTRPAADLERHCVVSARKGHIIEAVRTRGEEEVFVMDRPVRLAVVLLALGVPAVGRCRRQQQVSA